MNFEPAPLNSHTRVGKVARLPFEIREFINESLRAGYTYRMIAEDLEKSGYPGISDRNISTWKLGGYVDWLKEQQLIEARLATTKALERYTRSGEIDRIQQNALAVAADHLLAIMAQFNHQRALDLLYQKPELFPKYVAALGALARCTFDLGKAFDVAQARETAIRQQCTPNHALEHPSTPPNSANGSDHPVSLSSHGGEGRGEERRHSESARLLPDDAGPSNDPPTTFRNGLDLSPTEANGKQ